MLNKVTEELRYVERVVVPPEDGAQRCKRSITLERGVEKLGEPSIDWTSDSRTPSSCPRWQPLMSHLQPRKKDEIQDRRRRAKGVSHFASYF